MVNCFITGRRLYAVPGNPARNEAGVTPGMAYNRCSGPVRSLTDELVRSEAADPFKSIKGSRI